MKKSFKTVGIALCVAILSSSCIGSFTLTNRLLNWNRNIGNKFLNELVFFAFWVLPVYEVCGLSDVIVLNSIEFWSGSNPMANGSKVVTGSNGERYLVEWDENGYTITGERDKSVVRLDFNAEDSSWNYNINDGEASGQLFAFIDDTHVSMPLPGGDRTAVEISSDGLLAYRQATSVFYACR